MSSENSEVLEPSPHSRETVLSVDLEEGFKRILSEVKQNGGSRLVNKRRKRDALLRKMGDAVNVLEDLSAESADMFEMDSARDALKAFSKVHGTFKISAAVLARSRQRTRKNKEVEEQKLKKFETKDEEMYQRKRKWDESNEDKRTQLKDAHSLLYDGVVPYQQVLTRLKSRINAIELPCVVLSSDDDDDNE